MARLFDGLAFVGRHGTQGLALGLLLGIALPPLAALARPLLPVCILAFVVLTFARADLGRIRLSLRRPWRLAVATAWLVVLPAAMAAGLLQLGSLLFGSVLFSFWRLDPGIGLGLALLGAAPPLLSGPAIATLVGLEPTLILGATLASTLLSPFVSPPLAELVAGAAVPIDRTALAMRIALVLGAGIALAALWRRWIGAGRIAARGRVLDGAGVVTYGVFAVAAMDGVPAAILARPALVAAILALVFAISVAGLALTALVLRGLPPGDRLLLGYGAGHRNMGLLVAALGGAVPDTTYLFFALAQVPIYVVPLAIGALARRIGGAPDLGALPTPDAARPA